MSKYTTEVRFICEHYAGYDESQDYMKIGDVISKARSKVFDFDYPLFDEAYRSVLETKILKHFYLREIGTETVALWKHFLDMRLNEIMPYYNKLYESELIEFNPLYDVDLTKDYNKDSKGTGTVNDNRSVDESVNVTRNLDGTIDDTGTVKDTGSVEIDGTVEERGTDTNAKTGHDDDVRKNTRWDVYSDTPQGGLVNVENDEYLTNARKIIDNGAGSSISYNSTNTNTKNLDTTNEQTQTNNLTRTNDLNRTTNENETNDTEREMTDDNIRTRNLRDIEDYLEHVKGKSAGASFSKLLQEFRDTFLNIDLMIINDLNDLFFGLW